MGTVKIKIPLSYVQTFTDDMDFIQLTPEVVEASGSTVGECLDQMFKQFPHMKKQLFDKNSNLIGNVLISVNGTSAYPEQLAKPVKDGDEIDVVFMVGGG